MAYAFINDVCYTYYVNSPLPHYHRNSYCNGYDPYGRRLFNPETGNCAYTGRICINAIPTCSCDSDVPTCSCETHVTPPSCSCVSHKIPTCSCDTQMDFSIGDFIEAKDYNFLLNKVNEARTTHGIGNMSLSQATVSQRVDANFINSLIDGLTEANNAVGKSTVSLSDINKAIAQETIITAEQLKQIVNKAHEIKVHCHCNSQCSCETYSPPCSCNSKSSCSCDSKSSCSCDINCSGVNVGCGKVSQSCSSLSCGSMGCSSEHSCTCDNKSSSSSSSCSCTGYTCSCNNYSCSCTSKKYI